MPLTKRLISYTLHVYCNDCRVRNGNKLILPVIGFITYRYNCIYKGINQKAFVSIVGRYNCAFKQARYSAPCLPLKSKKIPDC